MTRFVGGRAALAAAAAAARSLGLSGGPRVSVALAGDEADLAFQAARASAQAKVRAFAAAGVMAEIVEDIREGLVIVQRPWAGPEVAPRINFKDLDFWPGAGWTRPAVCEAAYRVHRALARDGGSVAVVGSCGYFGRHLVELVRGGGAVCQGFDLGDDLRDVQRFAHVLAVAGAPEILTCEHLTARQVVIDLGYSVTAAGAAGNVARGAYQVPRVLVPVPGGMGPFQMVVLLERYLEAVGLKQLPEGWPNLADHALKGAGAAA